MSDDNVAYPTVVTNYAPDRRRHDHDRDALSDRFHDVKDRVSDAERRLDLRLDSAERQLMKDLCHLQERLADHDRRDTERLQRIEDAVRHEGDKTRDKVLITELEGRLYLRDREDRTHDLIHDLRERLAVIEVLERPRRRRHDWDDDDNLVRVDPRISVNVEERERHHRDCDHDHGHHGNHISVKN